MDAAVQRLQKVPEDLPGHGLPSSRHLPGSGSQPDLALLEQAKRLCPQRTSATHWRTNLAYRYGWWLYANQYFWETHEIWETVWQRAPVNSRHRFLLQCLIQLANARLKLLQGRSRAASRLLDHCRTLQCDAFPVEGKRSQDNLMGLSAEELEILIKNTHYNS